MAELVNIHVQNLDATQAHGCRPLYTPSHCEPLNRLSGKAAWDEDTVTGTLEGTADASWSGSINNLRGHTDLTLRAAGSPRGGADIPVDGAIHAADHGPQRPLLFIRHRLFAFHPRLSPPMASSSKRSNLQIRATTGDLHQLAALIAAFRSSPSNFPVISGSATLSAHTVVGSTADTLKYPAAEIQKIFKFRVASGRMRRSRCRPTLLALLSQTARWRALNAGRPHSSGSVSLRDWSYIPSSPIQANLSVRQMSVTDLQHLANVRYPWDLSANVSISRLTTQPRWIRLVARHITRAFTMKR